MQGKYKITKQNFIIAIFFLLVSFQYAFLNTNFEIIGIASSAFIAVEAAIFLAWILTQKMPISTFVGDFALIIVALINYLMTRETVFLIELMSAILFSQVTAQNSKKILKVLFTERYVLLCVIILFSLAGILPFKAMNIFKGGGSGNVVKGYTFGFDHPNQFASNVCYLIILYLSYKGKRLRKKNVAIIFSIIAITYYLTKSRTLFVIALVTLILSCLIYYKNTSVHVQKAIDLISAWIMPMCATLSIALPLSMNTAKGKFKVFLWWLNGLIGSRFTHSSRVFELYSVPLWGGVNQYNKLMSIYGYDVVDNGYINLLYDFGIAGFSIFIILYFLTVKKLIKMKEYNYVIAIMAIAAWGVTENILRSFALNFTVVFWGWILSNNPHIRHKHIRFR